MSGIGSSGGVGGAVPLTHSQPVGQAAPAPMPKGSIDNIKVEVRYQGGSVRTFSLSPDGALERPPRKQASQASQASSGLISAMEMLDSGVRSLMTGAKAVFVAFKDHPALGATIAMVAGRNMQQMGMPNLPAELLGWAARAFGGQVLEMAQKGGSHLLGMAQQGGSQLLNLAGKQAIDAVAFSVKPENVGETARNVGKAGLAGAGLAAAWNPQGFVQKLKRALVALPAIGLTWLAAAPTRHTHRP